ncbi:unnamed protein product [Auanema sp. JU1783]|nr:unnamed protein product [Auanema sp. JU1783]
MSAAIADGPPEAKKFRIEMPTEAEIESSVSPPSDSTIVSGSLEGQPLTGEAPQEGQSPAAPSSARSSNGSVISNGSGDKDEDAEMGMTGNLLDLISKSLLGNVLKQEDAPVTRRQSLSPSPAPPAPVPGAVAVAQSPAAQLFTADDWSWHRNPAAAIRSGGTNKQTPVWKYFVYNKAENLSRCIIGDCTYMLKGPHTSTLACHLKKHPAEYAEFQKLKVDYTRDRHGGNVPSSPSSTSSGTSQPISQKPKVKKEQRTDINNLANALRQTPTSATSQVPNLVQNILSLNPLQLMMNQQVPTSTAGLTPAQAASQLLQQAGLSLSATGQIMQSKKWRRDERRQRELESRLALALVTSHVPLESLQSPLWREFMECAQPKFSFPEEIQSLEQLMSTYHHRISQTIKQQISSTKRLCIFVEALKVPSAQQEDPILRLAVFASFHGYTGAKLEMQNVLLAFRQLSAADSTSESISLTVEQILNEYEVSMDKVSRVLCSGISSLLGNEETKQKIFDNHMEPFSERLFTVFTNFVESSSVVEDLRKSVFQLIFAFVTKPEALQCLNKAIDCGGTVDLPLTEPFPVLVEAVLKIKDAIELISDQGYVQNLNEQQWLLLQALSSAAQLFRQVAGNETTTIDNVIPCIKQLLNSLEKESIYSMIFEELCQFIKSKLSYITDVDHPEFEGIYVLATALSPQMAILLNEEQTAYARKAIEKKLCEKLRVPAPARALGVDALLANVLNQSKLNGNVTDLTSNPIYADLLQQAHERLQQERPPARDRLAEALVSSYFDEILSGCTVEAFLSPFGNRASFGNPFQPPLQFWQQASAQCPQLAELASELVSIPACPPSISRLLSQRIRDSPWHNPDSSLILSHLDKAERLERDLILKSNRQFLPKTY